MTHGSFLEIQAAPEALERRINLTETEIAQMKEGIKMKRTLLRSLRMALSTFTPRAAKKSPRSARSGEVPAKV